MATIIGVAQVKGGAGRSTLSTNIAGELSKLGRTVLLDCDMPQGTAASWFAMRQEAGKAGGLAIELVANHRELLAKVEKHQGADYIVMDGPPRIAEMSRAMVLLADLVLVPAGASVADLWATGDVLAMVEEAKRVKDIKARLVWTRHRAATRVAKDLTEQAKDELGIELMSTAMGLRTAYVVALGEGLTAAESTDSQARAEVQALLAEVRAILAG
jgi:chromosome partitioning protein